MNKISQTMNALVQMLLLRGSPTLLPYSNSILTFFIISELSYNMFSLSKLENVSLAQVVAAACVTTGLLVALFYFLLAQRKIQSRLHKMLTAWFGTEFILSFILILLLLISPDSEMGRTVQLGITLVFSLWNTCVKAFIVKQTMEIKLVSAILITLLVMIISYLPLPLIVGSILQEAG